MRRGRRPREVTGITNPGLELFGIDPENVGASFNLEALAEAVGSSVELTQQISQGSITGDAEEDVARAGDSFHKMSLHGFDNSTNGVRTKVTVELMSKT